MYAICALGCRVTTSCGCVHAARPTDDHKAAHVATSGVTPGTRCTHFPSAGVGATVESAWRQERLEGARV